MSLALVRTAIRKIYGRKIAALEALNRFYAALAIKAFLNLQPPKIDSQGFYWFNQTSQAAVRMFARAFKDGMDYGWFIAHGVDYGVYLTLANDRRHDALLPIAKLFARMYFIDVKKLFGEG